MQLLKKPLFILACAIFILHQVLQKIMHVPEAYVDSYLDNLLAMPIVLSLWQTEKHLLFKKPVDYKLSLLEIIIATIYIIIISEIIFPRFSEKFTSDWIDGIFFFMGSALFYIVEKKSTKPKHETVQP
ncbi:MAG: hypothetical protein H0U44_08965 [Flavisolibacter sp.]|jgi:hypothetical protein|nr:hypothetical protein [Flavisolibacter sp.]